MSLPTFRSNSACPRRASPRAPSRAVPRGVLARSTAHSRAVGGGPQFLRPSRLTGLRPVSVTREVGEVGRSRRPTHRAQFSRGERAVWRRVACPPVPRASLPRWRTGTGRGRRPVRVGNRAGAAIARCRVTLPGWREVSGEPGGGRTLSRALRIDPLAHTSVRSRSSSCRCSTCCGTRNEIERYAGDQCRSSLDL